MIHWGFAVNFFVALFALIDPVGNVPVFAASTAGAPGRQRAQIALYVALFVMGFLVFFYFSGLALLTFFGISLPAFRIAGGLSVYMTYAGLLLVFVPLLGARGISGGARGSRVADVAVALAGALAMALTLTRGAYVGLAAGLLAVLLAWRPLLALLAPFVIAAFFVLMPLPVRYRIASATNPHDVTMNDRVAMWKAGRAMIADRPLFGVGPGRVKILYPVYRVPGWVEPRPGHLHNNLVMVAAETGIPSALAYLAFVGAFFLGALRIVRRAPRGDPARGIALGAIGAMAALFAAGMFEYNFGDVEVLMATLVVATLPFAAARAGRPAD